MIRAFLFAFLIPISFSSADEQESTANRYTRSSIFRVITEQPDSIQHDDGIKLYLNPKNLHRTEKGHLLRNGQSVIFFPRLSFDHQGHYYLARRSKDDLRLRCTNPDCGYVWWFTEVWSIYCPRCDSIGVDE